MLWDGLASPTKCRTRGPTGRKLPSRKHGDRHGGEEEEEEVGVRWVPALIQHTDRSFVPETSSNVVNSNTYVDSG